MPNHGILKIILADDHVLVREGIEALLTSNPRFRCVGSVSSADDLYPLLYEHIPDILLIDLRMPGTPTLDLLRRCSKEFPRLRMIVFTMYKSSFSIAEAFRAGAHAFVAKDEASEKLLDIIHKVAAGERYICAARLDGNAQIIIPALTPREFDVMREIVAGMSTKEICGHLDIHVKTVEMYRARLLRKFGVTKATELVRIALESGMFPLSETQGSDPAYFNQEKILQRKTDG